MSNQPATSEDMSENFERPKETAILPIGILLLGAGILVLGNGLQGTLISVRAAQENMNVLTIGLMMSVYSVGFGIGSLLAPRFVSSVGHIRTFSAFASILSASALGYLLSAQSLLWIFLRIIQGLCYGVMILVIETWLNSGTNSADRGKILGIYQTVLLVSWIASQLLLNLASIDAPFLFILVSILVSLSLVPSALAKIEQPGLVTPETIGISRLYQLSPLALVGAFVSGVTFTTLVSMLPVYGETINLEVREISFLMIALLSGGALFQSPIGWWSDKVDRRIVIISLAIVSSIAAFSTALIGTHSLALLLLLVFILGAASLPSYPICIAHINDFVREQERLGTASALILCYGVGAIFGPVIAGFAMRYMGASGLLWYLFLVQFIFLSFGVFRYGQRVAVDPELKEDFQALPRTTYASLQLDDRIE